MAASSHELWAFVLCMLLAAGCAKGSGEGDAVGRVWAPDCGLNGEPFDLNPDFFAMQPSGSVEIIDNKDPDERRAVLHGDFRFLFERGLPTQYFQY